MQISDMVHTTIKWSQWKYQHRKNMYRTWTIFPIYNFTHYLSYT